MDVATQVEKFKIVDECCTMRDERSGVVVLESTRPIGEGSQSITDLQGAEAKKLACKAASWLGLVDPRISGFTRTYAVDDLGTEIVDPKTQSIAAYRADIEVTSKLI